MFDDKYLHSGGNSRVSKYERVTIMNGALHDLQLQLSPLTTSIILSFNKIQNGDIPGPPEKWPLKRRVGLCPIYSLLMTVESHRLKHCFLSNQQVINIAYTMLSAGYNSQYTCHSPCFQGRTSWGWEGHDPLKICSRGQSMF